MLAVPVAIGRTFSTDEGLNSQHPVAVISYRLWQTQFAGSADIVRQSLEIGGQWFRIIGVTTQRFAEPEILYAGHSQLAIRAAVRARPRDLLRPLLQEWAVLLVLGCVYRCCSN